MDAAKSVIHWMNRERIGAVMFEGAWRFPVAFRNEPELAQRFLDAGKGAGFNAEIIRSGARAGRLTKAHWQPAS